MSIPVSASTSTADTLLTETLEGKLFSWHDLVLSFRNYKFSFLTRNLGRVPCQRTAITDCTVLMIYVFDLSSNMFGLL
jgi:hypothetical protein